MNKLMIVASFALALLGCAQDAAEPITAVASYDDALATISQESISAHVEYLASDELEGRLTGEPGHELAARYVAEQFAALGLEPGGSEGWYQPVPLQSYLVDTENLSITLHRDSGDAELVYRDDFALSGDKVRKETTVTAELVYVGFGIHAPDYGYSDYEGIDVEGKIVVFFSGGPDTIPGEVLAHYASGRTKSQELVARGAVGTLTVFSRRTEKSYPWERVAKSAGTKPGMAWVSLAGEASQYYPEILASGFLSPDAAHELFAGTPISFEEARDLSEAATPSSVPLGIEATISRKTKIDQLSSPNVIGLLRGTDPELSSEYVVYSAHLDHNGRGVEVDGDEIYNGMYDNAMGTAMIMEAARALAAAPPRRSVLFIALTGEERGLLGSDYFAHYPTVPTDAIVANVNIDMPLFLFPVSGLVAFGAEHSSLQAVATAAAAAEGFELMPDPMPEENIFVRSDQYSFVRKGIPAIYLDVGNESTDPAVDGPAVVKDHLENHYHRPSDDLSRPVDWDSAVRFTRANARIGWAIGNDDVRPSWNEGDFFGDMFAPKGGAN
jgi:hypothetical protein